MNSITIATFNSLEPAEALKHRLEQAGIHAVVHDESKLQRYWFMSARLAAQKVEVDRHDLEAVKKLLAEWNAYENPLKDAVCCPECGSSRVEYPHFTRKFITPIAVEILSVLRLFPREFYCQECHFTWPKEEKRERELDILGWPLPGRNPEASHLVPSQPATTETGVEQPRGWLRRLKTKISAKHSN